VVKREKGGPRCLANFVGKSETKPKEKKKRGFPSRPPSPAVPSEILKMKRIERGSIISPAERGGGERDPKKEKRKKGGRHDRDLSLSSSSRPPKKKNKKKKKEK